MTGLRAGVLAALVTAAACALGCSKDLPACNVDAWVNDAIGDDTPTDCGVFQPGDPLLTGKAMTTAQSCVVSAAQGKQSFRFEYDQELDVQDGQTGALLRQRARVGWVGTTDTGALVLRWFVHPIGQDAGPLVMHTCESVIGVDSCKPVAPAPRGKPDNDRAPWAQGSTDACLTCLGQGPAETLCR